VDLFDGKIGLDPERLAFTCFRGNEALAFRGHRIRRAVQKLFAQSISRRKIGRIPRKRDYAGEKIFYYFEKKNWWSRAGIPENILR